MKSSGGDVKQGADWWAQEAEAFSGGSGDWGWVQHIKREVVAWGLAVEVLWKARYVKERIRILF